MVRAARQQCISVSIRWPFRNGVSDIFLTLKAALEKRTVRNINEPLSDI